MNWVEFLTDNHIPYVTRGPNTKRGEVSVRCPWCGEDDPSEHLGISLAGEAWGCHRNASHRGKGPLRLVQALLGCSFAQAKLIIGQFGAADPEALNQALAALLAHPEAPKAATGPIKGLTLPPECRTISQTGTMSRYWEYLYDRGFDDPDRLASNYILKGCVTGRWKDRLIIPVYQSKELVAWTGRALTNPIIAPRYLSSSEIIKTAIYNEDELLEGGKVLFITEGPFDALKIDWYGFSLGARATCVFGTSITIDQIALLRILSQMFDKVVLLLDDDAIETSFNTIEWLPKATIGTLPEGVSDPGAMTRDQVFDLINPYVK